MQSTNIKKSGKKELEVKILEFYINVVASLDKQDNTNFRGTELARTPACPKN